MPFFELKTQKKSFKGFFLISRYCFPFGRPEGALKATLSLLERVLMKDIVTPILPEEVRGMIKKSLETAALVNYTRLSGEAKIEGKMFSEIILQIYFSPTRHYFNLIFHIFPPEDLNGETIVLPSKKLEDLIHLAELCVDLLQQNEEHYAEVSQRFPGGGREKNVSLNFLSTLLLVEFHTGLGLMAFCVVCFNCNEISF